MDPKSLEVGGPSEKPETLKTVVALREELSRFASEKKIRDLSDRTQRGLEVIGMVALGRTRPLVKALAEKLGASFDDVMKMAIDLQSQGPWGHVAQFRDANDPVVKTWTALRFANMETLSQGREMDFSPQEFLSALEKIEDTLKKAVEDADSFAERAREGVLEGTEEDFRMSDDVPITEVDNGFLSMAIAGHESGIYQDADGMLFVGAKNIDDAIFEKWGLKKELRDDRGRKDVVFFVNQQGDAMVKKLYPGFVVVLSRSFDMAKAIAQAARAKEGEEILAPTAEALGHHMYKPSSFDGEKLKKGEDPMSFLRQHNVLAAGVLESKSGEMLRLRDHFFTKIAEIKGVVKFLNASEAAEKEAAKKGKVMSPEAKERLFKKMMRKEEQKTDELRYLADIFRERDASQRTILERLPKGTDTVMDMAGGAGDFGFVVSNEMLATGYPLKETQIVDPFAGAAELDLFTNMIIDYLPFSDDLREKIHHTYQALQEAEQNEHSLVLAKHACGDLTDDIIMNWQKSESPAMVAMTCCHDKAEGHPARYGLSQKEWDILCRESGKTNSEVPETDLDRREELLRVKVAGSMTKKEEKELTRLEHVIAKTEERKRQGMQAMDTLDGARVAYLKRFGIDAVLHRNPKFPKGDVIVALRTKREKK